MRPNFEVKPRAVAHLALAQGHACPKGSKSQFKYACESVPSVNKEPPFVNNQTQNTENSHKVNDVVNNSHSKFC